jgi:short-subunit dehydrogenase
MFTNAPTVVATSLRKLGKRVTVVPGFVNKLNVFLMRLMPRWLSTRLLGSALRRLAAHN